MKRNWEEVEEIGKFIRRYSGLSSEETKNSSELSFHSSEVSFDTSEEFFLSSEELDDFFGSYLGNSSEGIRIIGEVGVIRKDS